MTDFLTIKPTEPPSSWEVFDICPKCGTGEKEPCYNLRRSTPKNLVSAKNPHRGRHFLDKTDKAP